MSLPEVSPSQYTDVIESEEIIQYFHPSLLHLDYESKWVQISIMGSTFVFYVLQLFLTIALCNRMKILQHLRLKHRVFMSLAISRGIFGVTCIIFGMFALFKVTNVERDVVLGKTATSYFALAYTVGFFIFELVSVALSDIVFKTFSKMLLMHHSLALASYSMALYYGANHSFGCRGLLLEMSTPFSCLCFALLKMGKEDSLLWRANQIVLVHTFHLRSVLECYLWYVTYNNWQHIWEFMPKPIFASLYTSLFLVTFIMTPYWGYKKTQQLFNPVDWNFEQSNPNTSTVANGQPKKIV